MTTAHRPTFHAAIGGKEQGGGRYIAGVSRQHVHDLPGQMSVKTRVTGQGTADELKGRDLRQELLERETSHLKSIGRAVPALRTKAPPLLPPVIDDDDGDDDGPSLIVDPEDADDKRALPPQSKEAIDDDDDDDDDGDDDEEELLRELDRIKKERAQEALRKEREAAETEQAEQDSAILQGNPLLDPTHPSSTGSFAVKRRWDDDVVFKNQSREPKKEARRFINDTVRNDFHRKFLTKYIK
eukprot:CAMPEP_0181213944 /NCGR_PEP_ID=MMETSP1096-20121128/25183_1 /TAXON_ID=156174 ORGANISM="Chrysochromulina ericina, Strain CCMP281" /NCGR_SAMPLE_ID=MMETSP1096 /ASSEMBLY_ACC=CAM_ASM_000453 /LENGTH=240 /DNA_ID=CAMNT_0023305633 /DNA_START=19 /DNA_END=741 /DNA_ORIENTATION=-